MVKDYVELIAALERKGFNIQSTHPDPRRGRNLCITLPAPYGPPCEFYFHDIRLKDAHKILKLIDVLTK